MAAKKKAADEVEITLTCHFFRGGKTLAPGEKVTLTQAELDAMPELLAEGSPEAAPKAHKVGTLTGSLKRGEDEASTGTMLVDARPKKSEEEPGEEDAGD